MRHYFILLLCMMLPSWSSAQILVEAEALRSGLSRVELHDLGRGSRTMAEADLAAAGAWPNPVFDYEREHMRSPSGSADESWKIAQTFDLSGRRSLRQGAAERRLSAAIAENISRRNEFAAEIRRRFHEVLHGQQIVVATGIWADRFALIESRVEKLAKSGEASGYDRRRLARERQTAQAHLSIEQARLTRNRERLAALIGRPVEEAGGALLPTALPALDDALAKLDQRPELQILARRAEALDMENRAAARGWAPDVTLGIGVKRSESGASRDNGNIVTLSFPLTLLDRQQSRAQHTAAEALHTRAEYGLARRRVEGDLRGLHRQTEKLIAAAAEYRTNAVAPAADLLRIAEAAYQGGESTLLELLDAYRGALETEITALDLEWKAREARIDYDLLTGSAME